jgi:hypothetical protein
VEKLQILNKTQSYEQFAAFQINWELVITGNGMEIREQTNPNPLTFAYD